MGHEEVVEAVFVGRAAARGDRVDGLHAKSKVGLIATRYRLPYLIPNESRESLQEIGSDTVILHPDLSYSEFLT